MLRNGILGHLEQVEPPLQDVPKGRLGQLLEELLADGGEEHGDLVLVVLVAEAGIVKDEELRRLGERRQVAVEAARLLPLPGPATTYWL